MAKAVVVLLIVGAFLLFVGYVNLENVRNARKTGIISKTGHELGPSSYKRTQNPIQYSIHYWGSVVSVVVCVVLGSCAIAFGLYLAFFGLP